MIHLLKVALQFSLEYYLILFKFPQLYHNFYLKGSEHKAETCNIEEHIFQKAFIALNKLWMALDQNLEVDFLIFGQVTEPPEHFGEEGF